MNNKKSLGFLGFGILAILTFLSFAGAAITTNPTSVTFNNQYQSVTFLVTNTAANAVTLPSSLTVTDDDGNNAIVSFNQTSISASSTDVPVIATVSSIDANFVLGKSFSKQFTITDSVTPANSINVTVNLQKIPSEYADNGHLDVSIDDIKVTDGYGDDTDWYPLDSIQAKILVENNGPKKIRSISVSYGLYDIDNSKWIFKDKASSFSLGDGNDKTLTVEFQLTQLSKFDTDNAANYEFYIWATGTDDDTSNKTSVTTSDSIEMQFDDHFVILDSLEVTGTVSCGSSLQVAGTAYNIGTEDEENVYLKVFNTALGISQKVTIGDIDSMDSQDFSFSLDIPSDTEDGSYDVTLLVYDEDNDMFENSDGDESKSVISLNIPSGSCSALPPVSVTTTSESKAVAGQELDVTATVRNTGTKTATFTLDLSDYSDWASLVSIDKTSFTLAAGASQSVLVRLNVNADASGEQTFNILLKEGSRTLTQPVSVSVEKPQSGFSLTGLFSGASGNLYLYGIAALNILLVLIIIIVAIRVVRRK
jgi:hypothetical protein